MTSLIERGLAREMEDINAAVRAKPLEASLRLALARLSLVQGEYSKALKQLQLACQFDSEVEPEAQLVRMLVRAEQIREAVFDGKILPDLLEVAPAWLEKLIGALRESGEKATAMRQEALSEAPSSKGRYGEAEAEPSLFEWIADGDERLGPVIEVILGGTYYWVPFDKVESLHILLPKRVMDLVWAPVDLKLAGYPASSLVYMPARYIPPRREEERTDALLTGTETIWQEMPEGGSWQGYGRRTWYVDGEPLPMFEAGRINLEH